MPGLHFAPGEVVGEPGHDAGMMPHGRSVVAVDGDAAAVLAHERLVGATGLGARGEEASADTAQIDCQACAVSAASRAGSIGQQDSSAAWAADS